MQFVDCNNIPYTPTKFLSLDDLLLMPKPSDLDSRNDPNISLETKIASSVKLRVPIVSANMDTITEKSMALALASRGGMGILHRFYGNERQEAYFNDIKEIFEKTGMVAISVGTSKDDLTVIEKCLNFTNGKPIIVSVDVAHGHLKKNLEQIRRIFKNFGPNVQIIGGNVCTAKGVQDLVMAGAHAVKIGVGSGSHCSTRLVTGCGVPMATAIMQARLAVNAMQKNTAIIADGGIRNSGDIVKALALGADCVMIGGLFSATLETPGDMYFEADGDFLKCELDDDWYKPNLHKLYRGQSSRHFLTDQNKSGVASEGEHSYIPYKGSVLPILDELIGGIRSGMTYNGAYTLERLSEEAVFIEITHNGYIEGTPHGKQNSY